VAAAAILVISVETPASLYSAFTVLEDTRRLASVDAEEPDYRTFSSNDS